MYKNGNVSELPVAKITYIFKVHLKKLNATTIFFFFYVRDPDNCLNEAVYKEFYDPPSDRPDFKFSTYISFYTPVTLSLSVPTKTSLSSTEKSIFPLSEFIRNC